jgi:hypothetical protein
MHLAPVMLSVALTGFQAPAQLLRRLPTPHQGHVLSQDLLDPAELSRLFSFAPCWPEECICRCNHTS